MAAPKQQLNPTAALSPSILAQIRRLHFQTRRLADQGILGSYRSAFRGRGIEFEEVREYVPGDEVRSIDWKVTARSGKPFIKSYREERELTVLIAVDISGSTLTGSRSQLREALIAKVGAVLTLIALNNNDKVGLVTFSDKIESYHPPRKARTAVWRILHEVLSPGTFHGGTDLAGTCAFLSKVLKRRAILFLVSDFIGKPFDAELAVLATRHDLTAVVIEDPMDTVLPDCGLVRLREPESGELVLLDTGSSAVREAYQKQAVESREALRAMFRRHRVGMLELSTDRDFMHDLRHFFAARRRMELRGSRRR